MQNLSITNETAGFEQQKPNMASIKKRLQRTGRNGGRRDNIWGDRIMNEHILHTVCLTDNFADGQKITGVRLQYDRPIDGRWITPAAFQVEGQRITGISVEKDLVTLSFDTTQEVVRIIPAPGGGRKPGGAKKPDGPPRQMPPVVRLPRQVRVTQVSEIKTEDGLIYAPGTEPVTSDGMEEPVLCEFIQGSLEGTRYNLYVPKEYDGETALPLVLFIHDAGTCGDDPLITLSQGSGAISFAAPDWQKDHPCFVLAPQIGRGAPLTNDEFETTEELHTIKRMLDHVVDAYHIDKSRIYTTGQSMGCMASCELNIRHPDYFAASLLVAGQWSPERMAEKCRDCRLWILVSEHDGKAFPGMNAVVDQMEAAGAKVGRYWWDGKERAEDLSALARAAMEDDVTLRYTVFYGSSVVPADRRDDPGSNHTSTWNVVYPIRGLKEWLFSCKKDT